jgi:hypothetical protein
LYVRSIDLAERAGYRRNSFRLEADVTENLESNGGGAEKRRSTRVMHSASITVKGTDTLGQFFHESTKTVMVNCYGCQYQGIRYPAPNSSIMLEVRRENPRRAPRVVSARVIWVRRPQAYRSLYHVGIEFEVPGNVWDIALPPGDWFPCPEDEELVIPVSSEENMAHSNQFVLRASIGDVESAGPMCEAPANTLISSSRTTETLVLPEKQTVVAVQGAAVASPVDPPASTQEMVRMLTAEAVALEIGRIREFIDAELRSAIDKAIDRLSERIMALPALQQALAKSPISAEELRESCGQMTALSELPDAPSARDLPDAIQPNARQRRAAKRARKTQKATP